MHLQTVTRIRMFCVALALLAVLFPAAPSRGADADPDELAKVQGQWEREVPKDSDQPYRRATKAIQGNQETVTFYDADGKVIHQHRVDFKLSKTGDVRVFTYSNMEVTDGPQKGAKSPDSASYLYRASGDHFWEVNGMMAGDEQEPSVTVWTKAKAPATAKPQASPAR